MFNCFTKMFTVLNYFTCISHNDKSLEINNFSLSLSCENYKKG